MKGHLNTIIILIIGLLTSCNKPIEKFQINDSVQKATLELYRDSTFVEIVNEGKNNYEYSGTWSGELSEGSKFRTIATKKGSQIITLTPINEYQIINGEAVKINKNNKPEINIWKVDSLYVPKCKMCEDAKMSLRKLFGNEVNVGDKLVLAKDKLFYISNTGDTLNKNNYSITDESLEIFGSDWVDMAEIIEKQDDKMVLSKTQTITYEIGKEVPDNNLKVYLTKENNDLPTQAILQPLVRCQSDLRWLLPARIFNCKLRPGSLLCIRIL